MLLDANGFCTYYYKVSFSEFKHEEVLRMPNDLVACRNRIDANIEEQRKYRDVLASLSEKVCVCVKTFWFQFSFLFSPLVR